MRRVLKRAARVGKSAIACAAMLAISGCIYIPLPEHPGPPGGPDVRKLLGDSGKPLTLGEANREQVFHILGVPQYRTRSDRAVGYVYKVLAGRHFGLFVVDGPVVQTGEVAAKVYAYHALFLRFDETGRLDGYRMYRNDSAGNFDSMWETFLRDVPDPPLTRPSRRMWD
jgi:hypothetical protein